MDMAPAGSVKFFDNTDDEVQQAQESVRHGKFELPVCPPEMPKKTLRN